MNILVTGCAGFIGSHLTEKLLNDGNKVVGVDNLDPYYSLDQKRENLSLLLAHDAFSFFEVDLVHADFFSSFDNREIDVIVHIAGKAGVRPSIDNPSAYIQSNIVATQNILDYMAAKGIKKMAFASSSSVYGNEKVTPFREDMDGSNPVSPYAATKKSCELLNHTYHHLHNLDIVNMRFFTVIGPRQRPDLAVHKFTKMIRNGEAVTMFGDGSSARDYTYVGDTVQGIVNVIHYLMNNDSVFETVNLGNNTPVNLKEMIATIYDVCGVEPNTIQMPMQPGDVDITFADISKAQDLFDYQPTITFRQGVEAFVKWYDSKAKL